MRGYSVTDVTHLELCPWGGEEGVRPLSLLEGPKRLLPSVSGRAALSQDDQLHESTGTICCGAADPLCWAGTATGVRSQNGKGIDLGRCLLLQLLPGCAVGVLLA